MATTTTTTLPRPMNPPTGPLPALPVPKTRRAATARPGPSSPERRISTASNPSLSRPPPSPRLSSSSLPMRPQSKHANSMPQAQQPAAPAGGPSPHKTLRKTISIGSFPQPPKSSRQSHPSSPLSAATTPDGVTTDRRGSAGSLSVPGGGALRKRPSIKGRGPSAIKSPLTSPSALTEFSPTESRSSSANGSYSTGFEETGGEEDKGSKSPSSDKDFGKDLKGNVIVSVRVRPNSSTSENTGLQDWELDGRRGTITFRGKDGGTFQSDNVFSTQDNNARVYDAAAKRLVRRVMEGYHGTVFAYGMTGTGKTFSMQGTATSPGVIPLAITDIFSFIRETPKREFLLRVSYLEIYNERIHDLLSDPPPTGPGAQAIQQEEIKLREDSKRGVYATPLKEEIVQSPTQLLRVIARGDNNRRVAGTQFNARSSRSHAVVQIVVESRERVPGGVALQDTKRTAIAPGGVRVSTLSLIDLAGSEKAAEDKERRTEGAHINKSLLTLGTVIARLSEAKDKKGADKDKHLPYRDSKLTRLLQPALSGGSLVSILCTISIGSTGTAASIATHVNETLNTLKFASRAKNNIVSHAKKAEEALPGGGDAGSRALLDRYRMEIQELRKQLESKTKEEATVVKEVKDVDMAEERAREAEAAARHEEQMLEMQLARTALKERIEHLNRLILSSKSIGVNSGRSFSSMGFQYRNSIMSNSEPHTVSARTSTATLEVPHFNRMSSGGSAAPFSPYATQAPGMPSDHTSEEDDSIGENGDGTATESARVRALQADLEDKNRYIATLEKRLLQARRSSHSRVSMALAASVHSAEEGGVEALIKEKDDEIADLRARLDDKDRMLTALRSAARKRDVADLTIDTSIERRASMGPRTPGHRSRGSTGSSYLTRQSAASPIALPSPRSEKRSRDVEDITRMLDNMISEQGDSGQRPVNARRASIARMALEGRGMS
ncbi:Centromeric protein e [Lasiodiplodia theobromae]|uniref:Kinesin-like protein n=2 Tax=Lasiodiplodia theobromae TaxID=45133 RepID=A0A5N5D3G7_9PEZI|nr:Centromeric protein e [Lasiodiplodia theobromae]KAB2572243.1 Kinesin-like protein KIN-7I [Lasiodiplodia theobromae]KAF4536725.1 Centromeric protein e [Lasiodiplodia theobromae]